MSNCPLPKWTLKSTDLHSSSMCYRFREKSSWMGTIQLKLFTDLCLTKNHNLYLDHRGNICFQFIYLSDSSSKPNYQVEPSPLSFLQQNLNLQPTSLWLPAPKCSLHLNSLWFGVEGLWLLYCSSSFLLTVTLLLGTEGLKSVIHEWGTSRK